MNRLSSLITISLFTVVAACGSEGPMGEMGDPGAKGDMGDMGTMGNPGTPGQDGDDGANGTSGANGSNGLACWDLNGNGVCNAAEEDKNADTMCTVIDCQGAPGATGPAGPAGATAGQRAVSTHGTQALLLDVGDVAAAVPGLTQTFSVPAAASGNFVAVISSDGGIECEGAAATDLCVVDMFLVIDGALLTSGGYQQHIVANAAGGRTHWSFSVMTPLASGSHTISIAALPTDNAAASSVTVSGPVNNVLQGTLSVMLLKL